MYEMPRIPDEEWVRLADGTFRRTVVVEAQGMVTAVTELYDPESKRGVHTFVARSFVHGVQLSHIVGSATECEDMEEAAERCGAIAVERAEDKLKALVAFAEKWGDK
jgi:hypothetical protein